MPLDYLKVWGKNSNKTKQDVCILVLFAPLTFSQRKFTFNGSKYIETLIQKHLATLINNTRHVIFSISSDFFLKKINKQISKAKLSTQWGNLQEGKLQLADHIFMDEFLTINHWLKKKKKCANSSHFWAKQTGLVLEASVPFQIQEARTSTLSSLSLEGSGSYSGQVELQQVQGSNSSCWCFSNEGMEDGRHQRWSGVGGGFPRQYLFTQQLPGALFDLRFSSFLSHCHPDVNTNNLPSCQTMHHEGENGIGAAQPKKRTGRGKPVSGGIQQTSL